VLLPLSEVTATERISVEGRGECEARRWWPVESLPRGAVGHERSSKRWLVGGLGRTATAQTEPRPVSTLETTDEEAAIFVRASYPEKKPGSDEDMGCQGVCYPRQKSGLYY
jgi:hypothetical protein